MGGTFDPIHIGHLIAASEVHSALQLDKVLFMPAGEPWQKSGREVSEAQHRLAMTKLAIQGDDRFEASDLEVNRSGPTYSIDTVRELKSLHPDFEIFWIVGADILTQISTWHEWEAFVEAVRIVAVNRPGIEIDSSLPFTFEIVSMPAVRISATDLRQRYSQSVVNKYLVPEEVDAYIREQHLYGS